jgi:bifunctional UDP-N-acetylglucosamine pyrophosphorylase/glucosamine-1-phosphate N-acetyltransferase
MSLKAIILAAGKGTRMKSEKLKVLHEVAGKPIVNYVIDTVEKLNIEEILLVIGHQSEKIKNVTNYKNITYIVQEPQLGTGHAVMEAEKKINRSENHTIIVLAGDCPLIEKDTLTNLLAIHKESNAVATILTTKMDQPGSYGRILRGKMGTVVGIKEAKDCTAEELKIEEINTGIYCFESEMLFAALKKINTNNAQKEYYLTDVIHILKNQGDNVAAYCTKNANEAIGINTRMDLAKINKIIYEQTNLLLMQNGVTIIDPNSTFIDSTVKIGRDTIIYPFTMIQGTSQIGKDCVIGPNTYINNKNIADNSILFTK